jgi:hypothetical protein
VLELRRGCGWRRLFEIGSNEGAGAHVPNGPAPFRIYSHWLPDNLMSQLVDVLDDASARGTQTAPATSDDEVQRAVSGLGINGEPNIRQLEPDAGLVAAAGRSQACSVSGYTFSTSVSERPRKTKMARLSVLISSEVSDPSSLPSRLLGTAVNLSTIIRHGERRPL